MGSLKRGALVVIEGVDRSGKSTQCKKLVESLQSRNIRAELMNFPDRTTLTGKLISDYLRDSNCHLNDEAIHLLFSANRWENVDRMKSLLYSGTTVIVDRYSYSGIAFSSAKKGMDINWCKHPEIGLPKPDLVFLLTINATAAAKRSGYGEERYENESMQSMVSRVFTKLAKKEDNWKIVEASGSIDDVHGVLLQDILKRISEVSESELETLEFLGKI